jgi:hypothetical protein
MFFAILMHQLVTQHSFIKINLRRGYLGILILYLMIVYQTALYWEDIFSNSIGDYPNYVFLNILAVVVLEYFLLMCLIFPETMLYRRLEVVPEDDGVIVMKYDEYLKYQIT